MSGHITDLPPLPTVATLLRRLSLVFPDGSPNRANASADRAARIAFVFLYVGAVEGSNRWARPNQVTRMSDAQALRRKSAERMEWIAASVRKDEDDIPGRWYRADSREGIRDDTIRNAWQPLGCVVERLGVATTSSSPRWALAVDFARILTWGIHAEGEPEKLAELERSDDFAQLVTDWQLAHLSTEARAWVQVMRRVAGTADSVVVNMPDGSLRRLAPGDSSRIAKALIEEFAPRFIPHPVVLWLSESREHASPRDRALAESLGLDISDAGILPDVILIDTDPHRLLLIFCEVVATDGPMNEARKSDILRLTGRAGFNPGNVALMTAFLDRNSPPYRKLISTLAWGSFSWTASEPDKLTLHVDNQRAGMKLADALDLMHSTGQRRGK